MLTKTQRERLKSGEIVDYPALKHRTRNRIEQGIEDLNLVLKNEELIRGKSASVWNSISDEQLQHLIISLFSKIDDCWKVPGQEIKGMKQQLAIYLMIDAFDNYDFQDETNPEFDEFDMSGEVRDIVCDDNQ